MLIRLASRLEELPVHAVQVSNVGKRGQAYELLQRGPGPPEAGGADAVAEAGGGCVEVRGGAGRWA